MMAPSKPSVDCLSHWQISQWALHELSADEVQRCTTHAATCARCAALWEQEHQSVSQAATRPLPAFVAELAAQARQASQQAALRPRWARRFATAAAAMAAMVLAVMFVRHDDDSGVRTKGEASLYVAVRRDGAVREMALEGDTAFQPGDGVRLRVPAGPAAWVLVQKHGTAGWEPVFVGHPDDGGWLPLSFTISDTPTVSVRVAVCTDEPRRNPQAQALPGCTLFGAKF